MLKFLKILVYVFYTYNLLRVALNITLFLIPLLLVSGWWFIVFNTIAIIFFILSRRFITKANRITKRTIESKQDYKKAMSYVYISLAFQVGSALFSSYPEVYFLIDSLLGKLLG